MIENDIALWIWDIQIYGVSVCTAFGEYCALQQRILVRFPHLRTDPSRVSALAIVIMERCRKTPSFRAEI